MPRPCPLSTHSFDSTSSVSGMYSCIHLAVPRPCPVCTHSFDIILPVSVGRVRGSDGDSAGSSQHPGGGGGGGEQLPGVGQRSGGVLPQRPLVHPVERRLRDGWHRRPLRPRRQQGELPGPGASQGAAAHHGE